ncbi:MAG: hydantoinase/oxoprolinase family protein [Candidatus Heimdallarchaeota archaeon]
MKCLGIDIGGTFTDLILVDTESNIKVIKTSTTPKDHSRAIKTGLSQLGAEHLDLLVHGTTLANNAIIEQKGAKTCLITTKGFKDVLEIGRQNRLDIYSLFPHRTPALVPRELRFEIDERIDPNGQVLRPLSSETIGNLIELLDRHVIESIAIVLLFSFFNPIHEKQLAKSLIRNFPSLNVSLSSHVLPVFREYGRTAATVIDAYVAPLMKKYFSAFLTEVKQFTSQVSPLVLLSTGGVTKIENASDRSIDTVLSGLAAGALGGLFSCTELGLTHALSLDIGGTSTDVASIVEGKMTITTEAEIEGFPLKIPTIDVQTIGAGGGSIAKYRFGLLNVGPESAGADPGPVCYNKGGVHPTVTDAYVVLGLINAESFCGGKIKIYPDLAKNAISELARKMDITTEECASAIIRIFENNVELALRKVSTERGLDCRNFDLIAFGGAGPLAACALAERLSMKSIVIPPFPGVWSAYGLLTADIRHDLTRSYLRPLYELKTGQLETAFADLVKQGVQLCIEDGFEEKDILVARNLEIRLVGQSYELTVPYYGQIEAISDAFDKIHEKTYGYATPSDPKEIVNLRISAMVPLPKFQMPRLKSGNPHNLDMDTGSRSVYLDNNWRTSPVYQKSRLKANNILKGPCIIEQDDTTILVDLGWQAIVKSDGHMLLTRSKRN